ncbi:hypothetical protein GGX14DRAFT_676836 [Mycena pura]|uniref:Uncharacterized protein n=1 Tax=Mycena pura TaxID=153505 RepID=A0AAD6Y5V3_9AGAR|nr:hypothetical protein GGX14DRAFT_676836 [Mycena pura]
MSSLYSVTSSNQPYAFNPNDKAVLATRQPVLHLQNRNSQGGNFRKRTGQAAHCIGASESTASGVLGPVLGIVSRTGPDPDVALGVRNALVNGLWRTYYELKKFLVCPTCHLELAKKEIVLCPPLKILPAIRDDFDPRVTTMQAFLEKVYTKDFPKLRFLYHFGLCGTQRRLDPWLCARGTLSTYTMSNFCLHNATPKRTMMQEHTYGSDIFDLADSTAPHIWRFLCLKPENVMAVAASYDEPGAPERRDAGAIFNVLGNIIPGNEHVPGDRLDVRDERILKSNEIVREWLGKYEITLVEVRMNHVLHSIMNVFEAVYYWDRTRRANSGVQYQFKSVRFLQVLDPRGGFPRNTPSGLGGHYRG